ncbi:MAG: CcdB family protein [Parvibaculum sp.]
MAQYDVHINPNPQARDLNPYLVDLQSDHLSHLETRLIAPLVPVEGRQQPVRRLHPVVEIDGRRYFILMQEMAGAPKQVLSGKPIRNISDVSYDIIAAVDFLVSGI